MRPNAGKKGSRGSKGSKKEPRSNGKRGGKSGRGGGRGASKAGARGGRRLSFENGPKKNKMSGMRKGDLSGKDLRFIPVEFVKAVEEFELTLETKPNDEDQEHVEPVDGPTGHPLEAEYTGKHTSLEADNSEKNNDALEPPTPSARVPESSVDEESSSEEAPASASSDVSVDASANPTELRASGPSAHLNTTLTETDVSIEASDSDTERLDATLQAQFEELSEEDASHRRKPRHAEFNRHHQTSDPSFAFDESVSRLAIESSSDSDMSSPFEYDQYNASQVDEAIFESLSDPEPEPEFNSITYDDFDYSDMRAGFDSDGNGDDNDDDDDNMNELDDDQIFALASMATRRVSEYDDLDDSGFDKYDEFDEYFDQLLDRSTDVHPSTKQRASEGRRLKREARQLLHSMNFGKTPVLWQKYPEEIGVREVLEEIRHFAAQAEFQSLSFPPLDTNANWYVKQFAREHGLRPTIEGHHSQKHVICHLTGRATPHGGKGVNKLLNRRKFFRRVDAKVVGGKPKARTPGAKVRDGHVVGQHASEISTENFGHRLMRQMGWSEGSGLGKERGGIVAPIPATVKLTKTGLGA